VEQTLATLIVYGVSGGVLAWLLWSGSASRARRAVRRWKRVAAERGLDWHASGDRMSGWTEGCYSMAWAESANGRPHSTWVSVVLWPPLDLGLHASTGDDLWTPRFPLRITGDDPKRAEQLFTRKVRHALEAAPSSLVVVSDERILLGSVGVSRPSALRKALTGALRVASAIEAARRQVPVVDLDGAARLRIADGWTRLAQEQHLSLTTTPFGFHGHSRDIEVRVFAKRIAPGEFRAAAIAGFRRPLGIGFCARPHWDERPAPWSTESRLTGDAEFDERFRVFAFESEWVLHALNERARSRLCELAGEWGRVHVDDYGVHVESELAAADQISNMLEAAVSVAELVDFTRPERRAIYR
jgi:hypothetical protein